MRAWRLHAPAPAETAPLVLEDLPVPEPSAGELLVRVRACGVCRTDLHVVEGDLPFPGRPVVPGHMIVGEVAALGPGAVGFQAGERVGIAWLQATCGRCQYCDEGRENLCEDATFTGYTRDGGYAELVAAPAPWCYRLPAALPDVEAAPLLCAGIIGYRALGLSGVRPGERLGLVGFGNSAHLVLQLAHHRGCEVSVASHSGEHRALARELGAAWVGDVGELPPARLHAAILFAPAGELVPPTLRALRRGGVLACAGIHMSPIPCVDYDAELFGERVLRSVTANTRADGEELLAEAAEAGVLPRVERMPFAMANEALARLKAGEVRGAAVLVL